MTSLTASAKHGICLVRLRSNVNIKCINIAPVRQLSVCRVQCASAVSCSVVFPEASEVKKGICDQWDQRGPQIACVTKAKRPLANSAGATQWSSLHHGCCAQCAGML